MCNPACSSEALLGAGLLGLPRIATRGLTAAQSPALHTKERAAAHQGLQEQRAAAAPKVRVRLALWCAPRLTRDMSLWAFQVWGSHMARQVGSPVQACLMAVQCHRLLDRSTLRRGSAVSHAGRLQLLLIAADDAAMCSCWKDSC